VILRSLLLLVAAFAIVLLSLNQGRWVCTGSRSDGRCNAWRCEGGPCVGRP
jgi:hypothetical protein